MMILKNETTIPEFNFVFGQVDFDNLGENFSIWPENGPIRFTKYCKCVWFKQLGLREKLH